MNYRREQLIERGVNVSWNDVKALDWANKPEDRLDIWDHCKYKYLAHIEGARYSARLKYLQHCESVVVMHEQEWVHHYSHLIKASGKEQNTVVVPSTPEDPWNGIEQAMDDLMNNDKKARKIARTSRSFFGKKYLSLSAETCYWRHTIRAYASVQKFEPSLDGAIPFESVLMMRDTHWDI